MKLAFFAAPRFAPLFIHLCEVFVTHPWSKLAGSSQHFSTIFYDIDMNDLFKNHHSIRFTTLLFEPLCSMFYEPYIQDSFL